MDQLLHAFDRIFSDHKRINSQIIFWDFNLVLSESHFNEPITFKFQILTYTFRNIVVYLYQ